MSSGNITILVVDRSLKNLTPENCDLSTAISSLRSKGYDVITAKGPEDIRGPYDILILHPSWGDCEYFRERHRAYPSTPMILQSGRKLLNEMPGGIGRTYQQDAEGIFMNDSPTLDGLLELVENLADNIRKQKSASRKSEPVPVF